jgi:2-deoxy-D-gluconate 3-dehydrogenase
MTKTSLLLVSETDGGFEMFSLKNKVAIVTGGNRGIGKAIALAFSKAGADIVIVGRDENRNDAVMNEIKGFGGNAVGLSVDLTSVNGINQMINETVERFGKIDIIANNAGVSSTNRALNVTEVEWDKIMDLNVKSLFFCCQAAAKVMKEQGCGKIINMASVLGAVGDVGVCPYSASKGAIINLTKSLALEWAKYGIQVNAIGPAYIETELNKDALANPKVRDKLIAKTPMGRLGLTEEVTGAAVLLASDASSFITGQTIYVDGGWLAQ